jgi:hypothetical protein
VKKEDDVRNRIMKKIFQKDVQEKKKKFEKERERSRFAFDKEKDQIIRMIKEVKANQEIASLSACKRVSNKLRIIDI